MKHTQGQNLTCFQNNVIHNFKAMGDEILYQELPLTHTHTPYVLYMQSSGPAARPGSKFRPGRAFCGARTTSAGLMPDSREAITIYYALASGFLWCLKDAGWARCWAQQISCVASLGSGLAFGKIFAPLTRHTQRSKKAIFCIYLSQ